MNIIKGECGEEGGVNARVICPDTLQNNRVADTKCDLRYSLFKSLLFTNFRFLEYS